MPWEKMVQWFGKLFRRAWINFNGSSGLFFVSLTACIFLVSDGYGPAPTNMSFVNVDYRRSDVLDIVNKTSERFLDLFKTFGTVSKNFGRRKLTFSKLSSNNDPTRVKRNTNLAKTNTMNMNKVVKRDLNNENIKGKMDFVEKHIPAKIQTFHVSKNPHASYKASMFENRYNCKNDTSSNNISTNACEMDLVNIREFSNNHQTYDNVVKTNDFGYNKPSSNPEMSTAGYGTRAKNKVLHIGGLFDLSGSRGEALGRSELTAAKLAVDHINKKNVLEGYDLKLIFNDTGCDPGVGMDALYDLIYRGEQMLMVTGSGCSEVTKTLAEIVPYWNLILVSFASTSPALSAREKYKAFFRLAPADSSQNAPRAIFITHFGWTVVATLYEIEEDYALAIDEMGNTFEQNSITIKISMSFRRYEDIYDNLLAIKNQDVRIIIGSFSEKAARHVLCAAYRLEMFGSRFVWMLISDYVERWWGLSNDTTCTSEQLARVAEGYFTVDSLSSLSEDEDSYANISIRDFLRDYDERKGPRPLSPYATTTYDSLWAIALTLKGSMDYWRNGSMNDSWTMRNGDDILESFTYEGGASIRNAFFESMQHLGFLGISGPISFDGPDRKGVSVIGQNQGGNLVRIALYEPDKKNLNFNCRSCRPIKWKNGRAPRDKFATVTRQKTIEVVYYICVSGVSACGLVLAIAFLGFNLYHRRLRYIKLSSPKLNNVAVVGCMLVYTGIIMLGFNASELDKEYFPCVCTLRAFLFAAGFSLSFGAMFTKTYRVHQIFTRASGGLIKSKLLRDKQLLSIIGALLVVDSVILVLWIAIDPMQKKVTNLNVKASENDEDLLIISQLTTCHSQHMEKWTGALYAYKGLLLVFGVYMAWETRQVKIPALNDSQYIGMNVYNVVMMSVLVVALSNILSGQPTLAYVLESSLMLVSTTTTLCLLFVPKIYALATTKGDPIIAASGITVDTNCRRFAVDEKRELFFRAEVQNRVYRREIVEMDQEIHRLEKLLELPVEPYPRLTREQLCRLPESRVDPTPPSVKRNIQDGDVVSSTSDESEVCIGITNDGESEAFGKFVLNIQQPTPKLNRRRPNRMSIRDATSYAVSKLCRFRPRFSIGNISLRHEYEGMKTSPDDKADVQDASAAPDGHCRLRTRVSHPLLRQEAVEERRNHLLSSIKHESERSETQTFETQVSDNDIENCPDEFNSVVAGLKRSGSQPVSSKHYLRPPSSNGCNVDEQGSTASLRSVRRKRRAGQITTPSVVVSSEHCKISSVEMLGPDGNESPRFRRAMSIIEHERRTRIRKLQADLKKIQQELESLDELEYEVSIV